MRHSFPAVALTALSLLASAFAACGGKQDTAPTLPSDTAPTDPTLACDPIPIFADHGCVGCHSGGTPAGGLELDVAGAELVTSLLDKPCNSALCSGRRLLDSRDPELSVLLTAVDPERRSRPGACSVAMPPGGESGLTPAEIECVAAFARQAASSTPPVAFEPASIESALSKVKQLATGQAPTAEELTAVRADPNQLAALVAGWSAQPEFAVKMQALLGTALQQDSTGTMREGLGFPNSHWTAPPALREALASSFVRTAWDVVSARRPFTEVVTTRRWSVTTAELVILAFAEQQSADLKRLQPVTFVGLADDTLTIDFRSDPWKIRGVATSDAECVARPNDADQALYPNELLRLIFGQTQCRGVGDQYFTGFIRTEDYSDWRYVSFTEDPTAEPDYLDVGALRALKDGDTLALRNPRVGFATTPVFLDNWQTNIDNQYRVTVNQTLLVGLGATFSAGDFTPQTQLDSVDAVHAANAACMGCHRLMDPMRAFFSNRFDTRYNHQAGESRPASFAFLGAVAQGAGPVDLAAAVVAHPRFATAWVEKVCSWANSRNCNDSEPEVRELTASFVASNFDFLKLVTDTLSSPLVTGLRGSTYSAPADISISRRRHLCTTLATRLGAVVRGAVPCASYTVGDVPDLIPDDEFARGQSALVQPATSGTFYAAAIEQLCTRIAADVVSAKYPSRTAEQRAVSLRALTEGLMGLPVGHPRHDAALAALSAHVEEILPQAVNPAAAMQSTFIIACTSPDVTGVGL